MVVIVRGDEACFPTLVLVRELVKGVPGCEELRLHRDNARQRTMAAASVQVIRCTPLQQYRGSRPGGTTGPLAERLGGVMVIGRQGQLTSNFQHSL